MSSNILFDRKWKIVLEIKEEVGGILTTTKSKELKDLKVTFSIRNTLLGDPSLASFQIYNINTNTEAFLTDNSCYISFHTGYYSDNEDEWSVLFSGEITNSYAIRQQNDIVWNVWSRNAYTLLNISKPTAASIAGSTTPMDVLKKLTTEAVGISNTPTYVNGCGSKLTGQVLSDFQINGTYSDEFDDVLDRYGLGWQVQGDELLVFDKQLTDPSDSEGEAISISNKTGLLSVPIVDYTGVKFTTLMNGRLKPTKIINIEPNTIKYNLGNEFYVEKFDKEKWRASGKFRVYEVTHKGDTRGTRWDTEVTAFYRSN